MVCEPFSKYGTGVENFYTPNNVVCHEVDGGLPRSLVFPMEESDARQISIAGGVAARFALHMKVAQPPKLLPEARQCTNPANRNRVVALGRAEVVGKFMFAKGSLAAVRR